VIALGLSPLLLLVVLTIQPALLPVAASGVFWLG
jgi:hypothetical protein